MSELLAMDRSEAMTILTNAGFDVTERTWALGDSIQVAALPVVGEVKAYQVMTYLYPRDGEEWAVVAMPGRGDDQVLRSLGEAVAYAVHVTLDSVLAVETAVTSFSSAKP